MIALYSKCNEPPFRFECLKHIIVSVSIRKLWKIDQIYRIFDKSLSETLVNLQLNSFTPIYFHSKSTLSLQCRSLNKPLLESFINLIRMHQVLSYFEHEQYINFCKSVLTREQRLAWILSSTNGAITAR